MLKDATDRAQSKLEAGESITAEALLKLGIFSARRSRRFCVVMIVLGFGLGLPGWPG